MEHIINITDRIPLESVKRWQRTMAEMLSGYTEKTGLEVQFPANDYGPVLSTGIEFSSLCEHHLMPFFGKIDVGYLPKNKICGLSKIARTVKAFSRRLQLQERLTLQIANEINKGLDPIGEFVKITAFHTCQGCRGVEKRAEMVTLKTIGKWKEIKELC